MSKLNHIQLNVIRTSASVGRMIQDDFPCAGVCRIAGWTNDQIAEAYNISEHYGLTPRLANSAVSRAMNGYEGGLGVESYKGLLTKQQITNTISKTLAIGINGMDEEQRKKRHDAATEGRGHIPYTTEETQDILDFSKLPEYQNGNQGPSYAKIRDAINIKHKKNRTRRGIDGALDRERQRLRKLQQKALKLSV
tara:strand:+ start:23646 stop:24227 length:582 start_codon:yes stop_codon:yes gene_type:complete